MIFDIKQMKICDKNNKYKAFYRDGLICYFSGFLYCSKKREGDESMDILLNQYLNSGLINFREFYGAYHIILVDLTKKTMLFFADNAGNCCFYYSKNKLIISDSFLELSGIIGNKTPNYDAITEFIHFNCIYSDSTLCNEILRTDSLKYYTFNQLDLDGKEKELNIWDSKLKYKSLHEFMGDLLYASDGKKIVDIITGGTDSRTVLSHLFSFGVDYDLAISGSEEMIDVKIAQKIATKLGKDIHVSDEGVDDIDEDWLRKLFLRTDGVYGTFSRYRLHKKNTMLEQFGYQLELGGVAGELYKNSFLNQDFPFYNTRGINKNRFYKLKINPLRFDFKYFTETIKKSCLLMEERVLDNIFDNLDGRKSKRYFRAGSRIIRYRMTTLSNSSNLSVPSMSPFIEIDNIKLTYDKNPWKLELNKWQRKEVSNYCPNIADIETDRGLTLKNNRVQIFKEIILTYAFLINVGLKRTFFIGNNKKEEKRLDIFIKGRERIQFNMAMDKCKELNIINKNCNTNEISDILADRLMTIGLVFMDFQSNIERLDIT